MRIHEIESTRAALSGTTQAVVPGDISDQLSERFHLQQHEPIRRRLLRHAAPHILAALQGSIRRRLGFEIPFPYALLSIGERFAGDASRAALLGAIRRESIERVLVPGCYLGSDDVQYWARRGIAEIQGIDVYSLDTQWREAITAFRNSYLSRIEFQQASIEDTPFPDDYFDLISSTAVLEHVRNVRQTTKENARILRTGKWVWHQFGPLYFSYGGDHCISAYGFDAGYDHILLDEDEYKRRVHDQHVFDTQQDPNMAFWARHDQFSFLKIDEYLNCFREHFSIDHIILKMSPEALIYRQAKPSEWARMLDAGLREIDLVTKAACVIMRKP